MDPVLLISIAAFLGAAALAAAVFTLTRDFNDSLKDADELVKLYRQVPADLVNIIEYNPIEQALFSKPEEEAITAFMAYLEKNKVNARLRRSRGPSCRRCWTSPSARTRSSR